MIEEAPRSSLSTLQVWFKELVKPRALIEVRVPARNDALLKFSVDSSKLNFDAEDATNGISL